MTLIGKAGVVRRAGERVAVGDRLPGVCEAKLALIPVWREPIGAAKGAKKVELVEPRDGRQLVERQVLRDVGAKMSTDALDAIGPPSNAASWRARRRRGRRRTKTGKESTDAPEQARHTRQSDERPAELADQRPELGVQNGILSDELPAPGRRAFPAARRARQPSDGDEHDAHGARRAIQSTRALQLERRGNVQLTRPHDDVGTGRVHDREAGRRKHHLQRFVTVNGELVHRSLTADDIRGIPWNGTPEAKARRAVRTSYHGVESSAAGDHAHDQRE